MIYKFRGNGHQQSPASLELSTEADMLCIEITEGVLQDEERAGLYINKKEIDNLIISLTALKNEITDYERTEEV